MKMQKLSFAGFFVFVLSVLFSTTIMASSLQAPENYLSTAQQWADEIYHGKAYNGTPYYAIDGEKIVSWCFTVYKGEAPLPSTVEIKAQVNQILQAGKQGSYQNSESYYKSLLDSDRFATIFVMMGENGPFVGVSYPGLPLHHAMFEDAKQNARKALSAENIVSGKCYFINPGKIFQGFENQGEKVYVNMMEHNDMVADLQVFHNAEYLNCDYKQPEGLKKQSLPMKTMSVDSVIIDGVPPYYDEIFPPFIIRGCVPIAAAMILGYWDDHYYNGNIYESLIDGGNSDVKGTYAGAPDCSTSVCAPDNWYKWVDGWKELVVQLAYEMNYEYPNGVITSATTAEAIERVCNDPSYESFYSAQPGIGNKYSFDCNYFYYSTYEDSWGIIKTEINNGRPVFFNYGTSDEHDIAGWYVNIYDVTCETGNHAVTCIGYKEIDGGATAENRYRIVNWGSQSVDAPYYLCDNAMYSDARNHVITIEPGPNQSKSGSYQGPVIWDGTLYITGDVTINGNLTIGEDVSIYYEGDYSIECINGGEILGFASQTIVPDIRIKNSSDDVTGLYATFDNAVDNAISTDKVCVYSKIDIEDDITVNNKNIYFYGEVNINNLGSVTVLNNSTIRIFAPLKIYDYGELDIEEPSTVILNSYIKLESSNGELYIDSGVNLNQAIKGYNSSTLMGLYGDIYAAAMYGDGQTVYLVEGNHTLECPGAGLTRKVYCELVIQNGANLYIKGTESCEEDDPPEIIIYEDITIASNSGLIFENNCSDYKNCTIYFASGKGIYVNGSLTMSTDADNCIIFTRAGASGTWDGIIFNSGASTSSYLRYCTIEKAEFAVYTKSSITIEDCDFNDNSSVAIYAEDCDPIIYDNKISADLIGIFVLNGDGDIQYNDFEGPFTFTGAVCNVGVSTSYIFYNDFISNTTSPFIYQVSGSPRIKRNNFYNVPIGDYYIYNSTAVSVYAQYNYWGESPPNASKFQGPVDYSNYKATPVPDAGTTWKTSVASELESAFDTYYNKDYENAIALFKKQLNADKKQALASTLLFYTMKSAQRAGQLDKQLSYLDGFKNDDTFNETIQIWELENAIESNDFKTAEALAYDDGHDKNLSGQLLFNLACGYKRLEMYDKSEQVFSDIKANFADDKTLLAHVDLVRSFILEKNTKPDSTNDTNNTPETENKLSCYPNPFNASTVLNFHLKQDGDMHLDIYNTLGQRIKTLHHGWRQSGSHQVIWDGRDMSGNVAASGIYFAVFQYEGKRQTTRLLLLK